jgi:integrase
VEYKNKVMATLKYIIKKQTKSNGKFSVYLRVTHNRKPTTIKTNIDVYEKEWVNEAGRIKKIKNGTDNIARLNNRLDKLKSKAYDIICKLEDDERLDGMTVTELRKVIIGKEEKINVFVFWEKLLNNKVFNSRSTKKAYLNSLKSIKAFTNNKEICFREINYKFLKNYEQWNNRKGNSINGYGTHLRILKAIYNEAIKYKVADRKDYPFLDYKIKKETPKKKSLTISEFEKLRNLDLTNENLIEARNIFLISYYAGGMPFVDLVKLKAKNIIENEICYNRTKTGVYIKIPIISELQKLLKPYLKEKGYLFHYVEQDDFFKYGKKYDNAIAEYNNKLYKIGKLCNLNFKLTSYAARHTFATLSVNHYKMQINLVQKSMGHLNIKTTQTYLNSYTKEEKQKEFACLNPH